jgi:hypothetical protein
MNSKRLLGAVCAGILASSLGALAACGGTPESKEAATSRAVSAANVSITLFDASGARVGEGSGVMIAPRLVLTSGHLISGKGKWVVTSADGKQKVTGTRGMTYDWMKYDSNKAHPRLHDVGVIHLDESIKLDSYPTLANGATDDGAKAKRVRGTGSSFFEADVALAQYRTAPNSWLVDSKPGETLDTGGAVYDGRGILGIVSGRGMTTGKLYVARVSDLVKWLSPKIACAGGAMTTRTYAEPEIDKSQEICEDAGADGSSTNGSPSGNGGSDGSGGSCDGNNDGICSGNCGPGTTGPSNPGGEDPGEGGPSNPGGEQPGSPDGNGEGTPSYPNNPNTPDGQIPGSGSSVPGGGISGGPSGSGGSDNSQSSGGPGGGSGLGSSSEVCQGPNDNPDLCPPEPVRCVGPTCGGGKPDDAVDYGNCACSSTASDGVIRVH